MSTTCSSIKTATGLSMRERMSGIPDQNVNLRYRGGDIYQAFPTDCTGFRGAFPGGLPPVSLVHRRGGFRQLQGHRPESDQRPGRSGNEMMLMAKAGATRRSTSKTARRCSRPSRSSPARTSVMSGPKSRTVPTRTAASRGTTTYAATRAEARPALRGRGRSGSPASRGCRSACTKTSSAMKTVGPASQGGPAMRQHPMSSANWATVSRTPWLLSQASLMSPRTPMWTTIRPGNFPGPEDVDNGTKMGYVRLWRRRHGRLLRLLG